MTNDSETKSHIRIFLRARPSRRASQNAKIDAKNNAIEFLIPKDKASGYVNNQAERHAFAFDGVFDGETTQDIIYENVASSVVFGSLEGYNGTVFAYGQTGSGKTFTITGGSERYVDRGIIPRTVSTIFSEVAQRTDHTFAIHVSYLEIYNDVVYDLLDPDREVKDIEDLPRVLIREDEDGNLVFGNIRVCKVENEEEALSLLFLGDTNRTISETPMNMASSRSHCIFSLHIQSRKNGEDVVRKSKLNLVDLAGSERIKKTGIDGLTLVESKHINLSLHYLEQVIVALQENALGIHRHHIPYRNSAMTLLLRDSLGGNCQTVMIANISVEARQLDESISTCRFAQRVAMISNDAIVNEELDPALMIKRLKQEIEDLKQEIRMLKGEDEDESTERMEEKKETFRKELEKYCASGTQMELDLNKSISIIRYGFEVLREWTLQSRSLKNGDPKNFIPPTQLQKEVTVLDQNPRSDKSTEGREKMESQDPSPRFQNLDEERQIFRKQTFENNKQQLKEKFASAKCEGQKLTESKKKLTELKAFIEKKRFKRSVTYLCSHPGTDLDGISTDPSDEEEQAALQSLSEEKARYKKSYYALRDLKKEIENLQALLEHENESMLPPHSFGDMETEDIDSSVMDEAKKHFTGIAEVDRDILRFYQEKSKIQNRNSHEK